MAEQTIMLNCSAGMSTSLLVTKMQEAAKNDGIDAKILLAQLLKLINILNKKKLTVFFLGLK